MTPRQAAKAAGETTYVGKPCKLGHTTRYVCNGGCQECQQANNGGPGGNSTVYARHWRGANREQHRAYIRAYMKKWRQRNALKEAANLAHRAAVFRNTLDIMRTEGYRI